MIYPVSNPISPTGGVVGLWGTLAPDGAIVKVAGMTQRCASRAPRSCFDCEEEALRGGAERAPTSRATCIVIRYEGPKGGPGMREMLSTTAAIYGQGMGDKVALITDGRFSGAHARPLRRPCRTGGGGGRPDRAAEATATSSSSTPTKGTIDVVLSDAELAERRAAWQPRRTDYDSGAIWKYAQLVGPAHLGALTHPGAEAETHCYADI